MKEKSSSTPTGETRDVGAMLTRHASAIFAPKSNEPTLDEGEGFVKKGKLRKKGEMNPIFKERTFVLRRNGQLQYYDEKLILKGTISLVDRSYLVTSIANFEWKLLPPGSPDQGREYILRALSQNEMKEWLRALQISMEELSVMKRKSQAGLQSLALPKSQTPVSAVLREGIMFKKGESSATMWRERKFQLHSDCIVYADLNGKVKGKIELTGTHRVVVMSEEYCEFQVVPHDPSARHYSLRAKSKYEMEGWVAKINQCIMELRAPPPNHENDDTDDDVSDEEMKFEEADPSPSLTNIEPSQEEGSEAKKEEGGDGKEGGDSSEGQSGGEGKGEAEAGAGGGAGEGAGGGAGGFALEEIHDHGPSFYVDDDPDLASVCLHARPKKWVPDDAYSECMICRVEFSFFNRKHHCRYCGKLLCGECTPSFIRLPDLGYEDPVRVCISCIDQHFKHAPKETGGGCLIS